MMCRHLPLPSNHIDMWPYDEFGVRICGPMQRKSNILPENNNGTTIVCLHLNWYRILLVVRANFLPKLIIEAIALYAFCAIFHIELREFPFGKNIKEWISRTVIFEQIKCCIASYIACKLKFQHTRIPTKHTWMISSSPKIISFSHSMVFWGGNENHLSFHWFHFPTFTTVEPYSVFFCVCRRWVKATLLLYYFLYIQLYVYISIFVTMIIIFSVGTFHTKAVNVRIWNHCDELKPGLFLFVLNFFNQKIHCGSRCEMNLQPFFGKWLTHYRIR